MIGKPLIVMGTGAAGLRAVAGDIQAPIKDPITVPPVIQGKHGRAWLCDIAAGQRQLGVAPALDAGLDHWVIEAPWAHPAWHSYSLVLIHLRPMPDQKRPTLFYLDGATHEMLLFAINPDKDRNALLCNGIVGDRWLTPGNFAAQFIEITDDLARERIRNSVQAICDGKLSPDTDWRQAWIELYGDNMQKDRPNRRPPKET